MKKAFTLVEVMIVTAVVVILAALAIPGVLRARVTSNEAVAQTNLKAIANACEMYAAANNGNYPATENKLRKAVPPYQNQQFCDQDIHGYTYTCDFGPGGYTIDATVDTCHSTGNNNYNITTGQITASSPCE